MEHHLTIKDPPFETKRNTPQFKNPPRALTHKPISVSNEVHSRLMHIQMEMQYKTKKKVSFDEVVLWLLANKEGENSQEGGETT